MKSVFQAAKCVVGLSSSLDGKPLARCSGFFVEWDNNAEVGFVLTSGCIICTKYPSIHDKSGRRQYASDAQVHVHFANDTTVDGELIHYGNHYHIALFKIDVNPSSTIPSLSIDVKHGQDVFLLGRDENLYITSNYGRVEFENPGLFDPNHHMYINYEVDKGLISVYLIVERFRNNLFAEYLAYPIEFGSSLYVGCIPQLYIGLKLSSIKCLEPSHIEKISSKFDIEEGFIVQEVSEGSNAEKVGIKIGDIITCWNEKKISTNIDLDNLLLGICEDHLDRGNSIGSTVVVTNQFHAATTTTTTKPFYPKQVGVG
ncbi:hypothetical protein PR202_ga11256 [Eleusine coracana subsp. coracana]|uniref:PDZ domain-containing protein n=1 Tax=Eleusine coracana subsp. coracana TaxID=191504 RepID=A0AAV5C917_ELECO|nr:hypothetical protein PR202_ga11256 [Eleusine coracana subsp. coracana]